MFVHNNISTQVHRLTVNMKSSKVVVTITGIRPDFIRMANVFKKLDEQFNHILIHTGQHYDELLSGSFFQELDIRKPDHTLNSGKQSNNHYEQLAYLSTAIPNLFKHYNIKPDIIIFLGDSNSVCAALPLKKEGYTIGHIEAGMRSYDTRMLEEINRTVCDVCSKIYFVYHPDYKQHLIKENISSEHIYCVGNTIVEPCLEMIDKLKLTPRLTPKREDMILIDIHRPENFNYPSRLSKIIKIANLYGQKYQLPVKLLFFKRLQDAINKYDIDLDKIQMIDLMPYTKYLECAYHCKFVISDSGSACEELPLLETPVLVPREFTERPQSYESKCSIKLPIDEWNGDSLNCKTVRDVNDYIEHTHRKRDLKWLFPENGACNTSDLIIEHLHNFLNK